MKKLLLITIFMVSLAYQSCVPDQDENVGSVQVQTQIYSVNEPRWHDAPEINYFLTTEKAFYGSNQRADWANAFQQGTFHRTLNIADLLPGNYVIGFTQSMEMGNDRYAHLKFQVIGGRTTNLTLR